MRENGSHLPSSALALSGTKKSIISPQMPQTGEALLRKPWRVLLLYFCLLPNPKSSQHIQLEARCPFSLAQADWIRLMTALLRRDLMEHLTLLQAVLFRAPQPRGGKLHCSVLAARPFVGH